MAATESRPDMKGEEEAERASPHEFRLDILGASFSITADENPGYLEEVLNQYRAAVENTQNISGMKDPLKTAVLTGFLLCDEINKTRLRTGQEREKAEEEKRREGQEAQRRALNLIARIDRALENSAAAGTFPAEYPPPKRPASGRPDGNG